MTRERIRKAFLTSLLLVTAGAMSLPILVFLLNHGFLSKGIYAPLAILATGALGAGVVIFIFGFFAPVCGAFLYMNVLDEKLRAQIMQTAIWRWLLESTNDRDPSG